MNKFKQYQEGGEVSAQKDRSIGIKDVLGTGSPAFGMATGRDGAVMRYASGGMTGRDGCAIKGKTKGRVC